MVKCRLFISKALSNEGVVILNQDIDKKRWRILKQPVIQSFFFVLFAKQNCLKDQKKSQLMKHLKTKKHLKSITSDGMTKNVEHL